ncbi:MAG TPA: DMT family transporter [Hyphomicrobiaceae bacterium]|nr:DMT family transporter [Hyphomicrobiaceae bacterium]
MSSAAIPPEPHPPSAIPAQPRATPKWLWLAPWLFVALWSGGYTPVKIGLSYAEPIFFMAVRYMCVLALLVPAYLIVRPPLPGTGRAWLHLAIVGALIQGVYFTLTNVAIKLGASAAGLGIVLALQPILVALIVPRILGERVTGKAWLGLVLGLAGVVIVILAKSGVGDATAAGIATAGVALVFITAGTVWEKRFGTSQHPIVANLVQCGMGCLIALAVALPTETLVVRWEWPFIFSLAYLVIGNSIIAMTLLLAMIRHGQATRASALLFLVPPGSAAIAWLLLGEPFPPLALLGMALAGLGVWLVRAR